MTTDPHDEHGEILRRALHAEAETVIPAPDGLERIRARIDARGPRRFGWDRFTMNWARPLLAVAAAAVIAGIGVTAPQTIDLIQSTGNNGPSDKGRHQPSGSDPAGPQGVSPDAQPSVVDGPTESGDPNESGTPSPASSPGAPGCPAPSPGGTPAGSPAPGSSETPTAAPSQGCPSQTPSPSPTPTPTDPGTTDPVPTDPVTPPATEEPLPAQSGGDTPPQ
ncbi:hypothetical protein ACFY4C_30950 [Actinomadura viridis]|uniref:hypothetical protein n=1 Tax=Actinomadura viridis TaxID=58110 RepID=UPI0036A18EE7